MVEPYHGTATVTGSGVDWLTATQPWGTPADDLYQAGMSLLTWEADQGADPQEATILGYRGWKTDHMSVGYGPAGVMVRLSGSVASDNWQRIAKGARKITRLDMQVTCMFDQPQRHLSTVLYDLADKAPAIGPRKAIICERRDSKDGGGITLGKRTSSAYGRIYDKGVEAKYADAGYLWRYEVEYKAAKATDARASLDLALSADDTCRAIVHDYYTDRGIPCPWERSGVDVQPPHTDRHDSDDRRLNWIATQVAPVVKRLRKHGYGQVLDYLLMGGTDGIVN